ncbi:MAG: hypothetical protein HUJ27_02335 [Rhodobacteraceae bacterium]|nr:hypothetical protein [Paracoccaceae bacterium]
MTKTARWMEKLIEASAEADVAFPWTRGTGRALERVRGFDPFEPVAAE